MNYGYQEMVTLMNLQDAGLFRMKYDKKQPEYFDWNWQKIKDTFNLIDEGMNRLSPSDISYVYNGYSPISVRLIEYFIEHKGITPLLQKNVLKLVGVKPEHVKIPQGEAKFFNPQAQGAPGQVARPAFGKKKKVLVYFIGGITYAEIAALRFLTNLYPSFKFIIATTSIINGESALKQILGPAPEDSGLLLGEILKQK